MSNLSAKNTSSIQSAREYVRVLISTQPRRAVLSVFLKIVLGALNGFGIILLVPMLELLGVGGTQANASLPSRAVAYIFNAFGLSHTLENVLIVFLALAGGHAVLVRFHTILDAQLQQNFIESLRNRIYKSICRSEWSFFVRMRSSDFAHVLTSEVNRVAVGTYHLLRAISSALMAIVHFTLSVMISPWMSLLTLVAAAGLWPLVRPQNAAARQTGQQVTERMRGFYGNILEQMAGMKEAKSFGAEQRQISIFEETVGGLKSSYLGFMRTTANTTLIYNFGSAVALAVLLYVAVAVLQVPLIHLLVLVLIFSRLMPRLHELTRSFQEITHMLPAFATVMGLESQCVAEAIRPRGPTTQPTIRLQKNLRCRQLGFRYDKACDVWALRDIDVTLEVGSTLAIVGPSGSGKSTLADIVMGLLRPDEGQLHIDGRELRGDLVHAWRQSVGYVPQETFLLHNSIRENLLWSRPTASEQGLRDALRLAAAEQFVDALPQGMDTIVGDRGVRLSGGERQRLALARALLRSPEIMILDEATSALDTENEQRIQSAIEQLRGTMTQIVIAHRLSTVRQADQIIVLENGRIAERGTYDTLVSRTGGRLHSLAAAESNQTESATEKDAA